MGRGAGAKSESTETLRKQFLENAAKPGKVVRNDGDADAALAGATKKIEATYEFPFAPHATMEPMNCTVHIRPDGAEAWVPNAGATVGSGHYCGCVRIAEGVGRGTHHFDGRRFGRRYQADFVMEAAQVAKATGKPVMVLWTREDDMQHDFYLAGFVVANLHGAVSEGWNGSVLETLSDFHINSSRRCGATRAKRKAEKSEFATAAFIPYQTPNFRVEYALASRAVPRAWWRSVSIFQRFCGGIVYRRTGGSGRRKHRSTSG